MHALPWLALTRLCAVQYYCGQTFSIYSCEYFLSCKPRCIQKIVLQLLCNHCCCNKMTKYLDTAKRGITTTDKPIHICRQYKCAVYILVVLIIPVCSVHSSSIHYQCAVYILVVFITSVQVVQLYSQPMLVHSSLATETSYR